MLLQAGQVTAKKTGESVQIEIDGEHFTTLNLAAAQAKPYFHPVYAPGKTQVVRDEVFGPEEQQRDDNKTNLGHFHHKGLWVALDTINEEKLNYWHEKHKIANQSVEITPQGKNVVLQVVNHWLDDAEKPLLKETTRYTITPERLITCELQLTAIDKPVTFGDTKEGLLAVRLQKSLRANETGTISNADGKEGEAACWGIPSPWLDYSGQVDGKQVGISFFDDPGNFRPSRYHVRAYGLLAMNPFGESNYTNKKEEPKEVTLQPGESVKLRYGVYVHTGDVNSGKVAEQFQKFLSTK